MLNRLRSVAGNLWSKILLVLLVLSFAVWGIEDMVRQPNHNKALAIIGEEEISASQFQRELKKDAENLRGMLGDRHSPELLKQLGLHRQTLRRLLSESLLAQESVALGLEPGDAEMARRIRGNPAFQGENGFDKKRFDSMLKNNGMSEKTYVERLRRETASDLLVDTLMSVSPVSDAAMRTLLAARQEERVITLYRLGAAQAGSLPQPDEPALKAYYDSRNREFTTPEYRNLSYVTLTAAGLQHTAQVSEEALRAAYKERLSEFERPERRTVEQLLYGSAEAAGKARALIKIGASFQKTAKETAPLNKDSVSMGTIERAKLFEEAAVPVFSLKAGEVSDTIQSPFGWHIFKVVSIDPPRTLPFEEARAQLEKDLRQSAIDDSLNKAANQIEDALAGGATLKDAANELGLTVTALGPIDRQGNAPDGKRAGTLPELDNFLEVAFKTDEKTESPLTTSKGGVYYILRVETLMPERLRPLDEVRALAVSGWQKEERSKRLEKRAQEIARQFSDPAARSGVAAKYRLTPTAATIRRDSRKAGAVALTPPLMAEAFSVAPRQATAAYPLEGGEYALAVVERVIPANITTADPKLRASMDELRRQLAGDTQNEILAQYLHALAAKYPIEVNDELMQTVIP